jgi:DNA-binding CsgD family transcriptional regulator
MRTYRTAFDAFLERLPPNREGRLSPREKEVVRLRREGFSVVAMCQILGITKHTLWCYQQRIMKKYSEL